MSIYQPKRKTESGVEDVTLPISSIEGLDEEIKNLNNKTMPMPIIRLANVSDSNNTMVIGSNNPLIFSVEILSGQLQEGDEVQICTRQLFTYKHLLKRKYRLRKQWSTKITSENMHDKFIFVAIKESAFDDTQRFFRTGTNTNGSSTLSPIYIRIRRPVFNKGKEVSGTFSNIITVWKKYNLGEGKVFIK